MRGVRSSVCLAAMKAMMKNQTRTEERAGIQKGSSGTVLLRKYLLSQMGGRAFQAEGAVGVRTSLACLRRGKEVGSPTVRGRSMKGSERERLGWGVAQVTCGPSDGFGFFFE